MEQPQRLTWVNVEREDEPRWGDRHSVQTDELGTPLYVIHCHYRSTRAQWWVGDFLEWISQECWTLKEAQSLAQDHYDKAQVGIIGQCDNCGLPITELDNYLFDTVGMLHESCNPPPYDGRQAAHDHPRALRRTEEATP